MTFYASVAGINAIEVEITIPYLGRWTCDAKVDTGMQAPIGAGALPIVLAETLKLTSTTFRSSPYQGAVRVRSVGGFGGWHKPIGPIPYSNPGGLTLSYVLSDIASRVGEKLVVSSDASIGTWYSCPFAPAARSLNLLSRSIWWMDLNGITNIGPRPSSLVMSAFDVLHYDGAMGRFEIASETPGDWLPGNQFSSSSGIQTMSTVIHKMTNESLRTFVQVIP